MSPRSHYGTLVLLVLLSFPMSVDAQIFEVFGAGEESPAAVGPSFRPNLTTESETIIFGPEGTIGESDAPGVCFGLAAPGRYSASDPSFPDGSCSLGFMGAMDSTLVHYNSLGSDGGMAAAVVVMERPVVGLSVARESLLATDRILDPTGRANYSQDAFRGLEAESTGVDSLALGANRHVISFDLTTTDRLDHTRVFTKAVMEAANLVSCIRNTADTHSASFRVNATGPQGETATLLARFPDEGDCIVGEDRCPAFGVSNEGQLATCSLGSFSGDVATVTRDVTCTWTNEKPQLTLLGGTNPVDLASCLGGGAPRDAGVGDGSVLPADDAGANNPIQFSGGAACDARANGGMTSGLSLFLLALGLLWRGRRVRPLPSPASPSVTNIAWTVWVLSLVCMLGCGGTNCAPRTGASGTVENTTGDGLRDQPSPTHPSPSGNPQLLPLEQATPMTLRIVNDRPTASTVDISFGRLAPFTLEHEPGAQTLTLSMAHVIEGPSCTCRCGYECLQCEPPQYEEVAVPAQGSYEVQWPGWVQAWRNEHGEGCHDPYALAPGSYQVTACLGGAPIEEGECTTQTVQFPAEVLEFRFSGTP